MHRRHWQWPWLWRWRWRWLCSCPEDPVQPFPVYSLIENPRCCRCLTALNWLLAHIATQPQPSATPTPVPQYSDTYVHRHPHPHPQLCSCVCVKILGNQLSTSQTFPPTALRTWQESKDFSTFLVARKIFGKIFYKFHNLLMATPRVVARVWVKHISFLPWQLYGNHPLRIRSDSYLTRVAGNEEKII